MAFRYAVRDISLSIAQTNERIQLIRLLAGAQFASDATLLAALTATGGFSNEDAIILITAVNNIPSSASNTEKQEAILNAWLPENELVYNSADGALNIRRGNNASTVAGSVVQSPFQSFRFTIMDASQDSVPASFADTGNTDVTDDTDTKIMTLGDLAFTDVNLNGVKLVIGRDWLFEDITVGTGLTEVTGVDSVRFVELKTEFRPTGATSLDPSDYPTTTTEMVEHPDGTTGQVVALTLYNTVPVTQEDIVCVVAYDPVNPSVVNAGNVIGNFQNAVLVNNGVSTLTMEVDGSTVNYTSAPGTTNAITTTPDNSVAANSIDGSDTELLSNRNHTIKKGSTANDISFTSQTMTWLPLTGSSTFNAVANTGYLVNISAAITCTLPTSPAPVVGDMIKFIDVGNNFATNTFTISSTSDIQGDATDFDVSTNRAGFTLVFTGATGWVLAEK